MGDSGNDYAVIGLLAAMAAVTVWAYSLFIPFKDFTP